MITDCQLSPHVPSAYSLIVGESHAFESLWVAHLILLTSLIARSFSKPWAKDRSSLILASVGTQGLEQRSEANISLRNKMARKCGGGDCNNDAGTLQCPTCQKQGQDSFFCSQECFKRNWVCESPCSGPRLGRTKTRKRRPL